MNRQIVIFASGGLGSGIIILLISWDTMSHQWPMISWITLCAVLLIYVWLRVLWEKRYE